MNRLKIIVFALVFGIIAAPIIVVATTPAEIIKTKIREKVMSNILFLKGDNLDFNPNADFSQKIDLTMDFDMVEKFLQKGKPADTAYGKIRWTLESYPISETEKNIAITIDMPVIRQTSSGVHIEYEHPFSLESRVFNNKLVYVRLMSLSDELKKLLKDFGFDFESVIGEWIMIDVNIDAQKLDPGNDALEIDSRNATLVRFKNWYGATEKKSGSPLTIAGYEKIKKLPNGEKTQVVSIKLNSRWYDAFGAYLFSEYKIANPDATKREIDAKKKAITAGIKSYRTEIDRVKFKVTVNLQSGTVPVITARYTKTEPTYDIDYSYVKNKLITKKKQRGKRTFTGNWAVVFSPTEKKELEQPQLFFTAEEAWNKIYPKKEISVEPVNGESSASETTF